MFNNHQVNNKEMKKKKNIPKDITIVFVNEYR